MTEVENLIGILAVISYFGLHLTGLFAFIFLNFLNSSINSYCFS